MWRRKRPSDPDWDNDSGAIWRSILIGLSVPIGMFVAGVIFAVYRYLMVFTAAGFPSGPDPGVVTPYSGITRSLAVESAALGHVGDIRYFPGAPEARQVGIAGELGILLTDTALSLHPVKRLSQPRFDAQFYGVNDTGYAGIIGVHFSEGATVYDAEGRALWDVDPHFGIWSMAAVDFEGDGQWHFVVGYEQRGIGLLDARGNEVWRRGGPTVWQVGARELRGDRGSLIIYAQSPGELGMIDASGTETYRDAPLVPWGRFYFTPWPNPDSNEHLIRVQDGCVLVATTNGVRVTSYELPVAGRNAGFAATPVRLREGTPPYFAVTVALYETTHVHLFNSRRELVFFEVLENGTTALAAIPEPGGEAESLLVGGEGKVWRYRFAESPEGEAQ